MTGIVIAVVVTSWAAVVVMAMSLCRMSARFQEAEERCQEAEYDAMIATEALAMRERARMEQRQKVAAV